MQRSFRQTLPYVMGAMRLLAASFTPVELNKVGFALYADFRPEVTEWGGRSEMRCERILEMRKVQSRARDMVKEGESQATRAVPPIHATEPPTKRLKNDSLDEFEDAFDDDIDFDDPSLQGL